MVVEQRTDEKQRAARVRRFLDMNGERMRNRSKGCERREWHRGMFAREWRKIEKSKAYLRKTTKGKHNQNTAKRQDEVNDV